MSRSSNNGAKGAVFLALLLLAASPAGAQTPNPPGGGSGGGGSGCTTAGSNGDVVTDDGAGGCNSDGSALLTAGALSLGSSGVLGTLTLGNATSGTITLGTVAGALGTVTATLPANSGTLAELNLAQSWPAVQTFASPVLNGTVSGTGVSQAAAANTLAQSDANSNIFGNNFLANATLTVGSGGTTTLTAASSRYQALSTAAQTYVLPDATTLSLGPWFAFNNNSSGALMINKNGGTLQYTVPAGGVAQCGPTNISTAAGTWDCHAYVPSSASWGTGIMGLQMNNVLSTTAQIGAGASSCTAPNFIPQRTAGTTGFGGAGTNVCGAVGGVTTFTSTATAFNIPTGANYQINGTQIACANLSNGATGCSTDTGTSGATIPLLNGANTWSGVQTFTNSDIAILGSSTGKTTLTSDNAGASNFTVHIPAANDTAALLAASQALTNKTYNGLTITASSGTLTIANLKTATINNTMTFTGTDGSSVAFGTGGTIGPVGYAAQGNIPGASTNTVPSAGNIGEPFTSTIPNASAVSLTTGTATDITSITPTAGSYQICGEVYFTAGASTVTTVTVGYINFASGTVPVPTTSGTLRQDWNGSATGNTTTSASLGCMLVHTTGASVFTLGARATFSTSTLAAYGRIDAWRVN